ncbi:MAG: hypothetical protein SGPRY_006054 [Prymnesium sp.]
MAGEDAPDDEEDMLNGMVATSRQYDEDVFGMMLVQDEQKEDMAHVLSNVPTFTNFALQFAEPTMPSKEEINFESVSSVRSQTLYSHIGSRPSARVRVRVWLRFTTRVLQLRCSQVIKDLILFTTHDDITDPMLREGIPHPKRQMLLREQHILAFAIKCVALPFNAKIFSSEDLDHPSKRVKGPSAELHMMGCLAMRLCRHIIRESEPTKLFTLRGRGGHDGDMGCASQVADVVTEIFTDNEHVDKVDDSSITRFIELIRTAGRKQQYVDFLIVLCKCNGKAVRPNQNRVAKFLVGEAPELLLKLVVSGGVLQVSGDTKYFPALKAHAGESSHAEMPLDEWLKTAGSETIKYFERCAALFSAMVEGRNQFTSALIKKHMPYEMLLALVKNPAISNDLKNASISAEFVGKPDQSFEVDFSFDSSLSLRTLVMSAALSGLIRHLYIDNEPHELMARLNSIRIWKNIETAAESMRLSTRLTMGKGIDFERFEELEDFTMSHVRNFVQQDAREIGKNLLVIQLLRLLMAMIQMGFVTTFELVPMLPVLLGILDGREDVVGENAEAEERYQIKRNKKVDTLVLMECKLVVCEILQLVCTIRLDLELDPSWQEYENDVDIPHRKEDNAGDDDDDTEADASCNCFPCFSSPKALGYAQLKSKKPADVRHIRVALFRELDTILKLDPTKEELTALTLSTNVNLATVAKEALAFSPPPLEPVLTDIVRYNYPPLVDAALSLLYEHSRQASKLCNAGFKTQLLLKPMMKLSVLLRKLGRLSSRRRLIEDEPYTAAYVMGQLTAQCYEAANEGEGVARSVALTARTKTDHTAGMYLRPIGKCTVTFESDVIEMTCKGLGDGEETRGVMPYDKLQILNTVYTVSKVDSTRTRVTLTEPVSLPEFMVDSKKRISRPSTKKSASKLIMNDLRNDVWVLLVYAYPSQIF